MCATLTKCHITLSRLVHQSHPLTIARSSWSYLLSIRAPLHVQVKEPWDLMHDPQLRLLSCHTCMACRSMTVGSHTGSHRASLLVLDNPGLPLHQQKASSCSGEPPHLRGACHRGTLSPSLGDCSHCDLPAQGFLHTCCPGRSQQLWSLSLRGFMHPQAWEIMAALISQL